jgi:alkylation response protein AidB-like acyl-CoA dehydrogenase
MAYLGKDATKAFEMHHAPEVLFKYQKMIVGSIDQEVPEKPNLSYCEPSYLQGWQSPYYTDSHYRLRKWVRAFVEKEIMPFVNDWEKNGSVPRSVYELMGQNGLLTSLAGINPWPTEYSPCPPPCGISVKDWDVFHELIVGDELARVASTGVTSALTLGPSIALPPIFNFGSKAMKDKVISKVLGGKEYIALAITEP